MSELSQILEYWKGYMSAQRLVSDPSRGLYGLSEHEMELARIGDEFEQALAATEWSLSEKRRRWLLSHKRYRVVRVIHKRGSQEIAIIYINMGPYQFDEAQRLVDWFNGAYANGDLYRARNYMQEIDQ